jgi:hypothetical protein
VRVVVGNVVRENVCIRLVDDDIGGAAVRGLSEVNVIVGWTVDGENAMLVGSSWCGSVGVGVGVGVEGEVGVGVVVGVCWWGEW